MNLIAEAHDIAQRVHKNQTRDDNLEPYINHCKRVARIISSHFGSYATDETIATALLHDTLEDCNPEDISNVYRDIYTKCSPRIAANVDLLTKPRAPKEFSKKRYLATLSVSPNNVIIVKLADRIDNLNSIPHAKWGMKRILYYIDDSVAIYDVACVRGLLAEAQQLLTTIMLTEAHLNSINLK